MDFDKIILGENHIYTSNMEESRINNNILVMASSGAGKTHSIIEPCLLETNNSSVVLIDPKGVLYKKYGDYLLQRDMQYKPLILIHWTEIVLMIQFNM